jgi:transcription elongation factor Elf1
MHRGLSRIAAAARRLASAEDGLHRCPACGHAFVCPVEWDTDGDHHWLIQLRCAACEIRRDVRVTNAQARSFELMLDGQTAGIRRTLERLERERMEAELETLVAAFERDLIDAGDFAR